MVHIDELWRKRMFDISKVKTPCYVVDEAKLLKNLTILDMSWRKRVVKYFWHRKLFPCIAHIL